MKYDRPELELLGNPITNIQGVQEKDGPGVDALDPALGFIGTSGAYEADE